MSRVKGGVVTRRRHKKVLKAAKGFKWSRKSRYSMAREALLHAGRYAYRDRRTKKREFRKLWQLRVNAASRLGGLSYSALLGNMKKAGIALDRKVLSELASSHPEVFAQLARRAGRTA